MLHLGNPILRDVVAFPERAWARNFAGRLTAVEKA
jgi:hypothetical protein